ncbi:hypothetical protein AJ78_07990 [Emergomyces pasteurianus Ep9510]|uniref:Uncharacterized protein n=1 Tax=Emergomyces pasteurianus Ep9510 TaxID=1447872 RepID=A0A1J9P4W9_9EURO|nr:hypothetical protein AJ78_07990 [Emergomyces pasteurianus Ep9510]
MSLQHDLSKRSYLSMIKFSYEFTKKYLDLIQTNMFILLKIIYELSLILSLHIFLFNMLFFFKTFCSFSLISMIKLRRLKIKSGQQQLLILLKLEMINYYVFCRVIKKNNKICIFFKEMMNSLFSDLILNKSELIGDAEQNLVMKHASIRTFLEHYISCRIGCFLNKQCLQHLTDVQKTIVEQNLKLQKVIQKRDRAKQRVVRINNLKAIKKLEK